MIMKRQRVQWKKSKVHLNRSRAVWLVLDNGWMDFYKGIRISRIFSRVFIWSGYGYLFSTDIDAGLRSLIEVQIF